jgi:hypothetical protein
MRASKERVWWCSVSRFIRMCAELTLLLLLLRAGGWRVYVCVWVDVCVCRDTAMSPYKEVASAFLVIMTSLDLANAIYRRYGQNGKQSSLHLLAGVSLRMRTQGQV